MKNRASLAKRGIVFAVTLVALLGTASAWDFAGHMLVGQIAWEKSSSATRARVSELVRLLPSQHNEQQAYNFVTSNCWMDDMRSEPGYAWAKLHYVTIPWTPDASKFQLPEAPHVVQAIKEMRTKLANRGQLTPEQQAEALAMLIHFIGDLHQPMHATDRDDRGGNGFYVMGIPLSTMPKKRPGNLHYLWDAAFRVGRRDGKISEFWHQPEISSRPKAPGEGVIASEAAKLMQQFPEENLPELRDTPLDPEHWAKESHEIGCRSGYPEGTAPSDSEVHKIPDDFIVRAQEIAARRVTVAGYRLATVLNQLFAAEK